MTPAAREAGRVFVLRDDGRVLLFEFCDPLNDRRFWITPGGGLEDGESHEQGAIRELREETGLVAAPGEMPAVGERTLDILYGDRSFRQHEVYFLLRVPIEAAVITTGQLDYEATDLVRWAWMPPEEIEARIAAGEHFGPRGMGGAGGLVAQLHRGWSGKPLSLN